MLSCLCLTSSVELAAAVFAKTLWFIHTGLLGTQVESALLNLKVVPLLLFTNWIQNWGNQNAKYCQTMSV